MNTSVLITLIVMVGLVLIAMLALGAWVSVQRRAQPAKDYALVTGGYGTAPNTELQDAIDNDLAHDALAMASQSQQAVDTEQEVAAPIPIDPNNPPHWTVYAPRPEAPERNCNCHDEPLPAQQPVLWWPQPDRSVLLFCERSAGPAPEKTA